MELDKESIKALAAEKRVDILKSLAIRRKMPSELSRELNIVPSTVVEHLKKLEKAGFVKKVETGHKWIYYELTNKGEDLVKPKIPVQVFLILSVGIILMFSGALNIYKSSYELMSDNKASEISRDIATGASGITIQPASNTTEEKEITEFNPIGLLVLIVGLFTTLAGLLYIRNKRF